MSFKEFFYESADFLSTTIYGDKNHIKLEFSDLDARVFIIFKNLIILGENENEFHGNMLFDFYNLTDEQIDEFKRNKFLKLKYFTMIGEYEKELKKYSHRSSLLEERKNYILGRLWIKPRNKIYYCSFWNTLDDIGIKNLSQINEVIDYYKLNMVNTKFETGDQQKLYNWSTLCSAVKNLKSSSAFNPLSKGFDQIHMLPPELKGQMMKLKMRDEY